MCWWGACAQTCSSLEMKREKKKSVERKCYLMVATTTIPTVTPTEKKCSNENTKDNDEKKVGGICTGHGIATSRHWRGRKVSKPAAPALPFNRFSTLCGIVIPLGHSNWISLTLHSLLCTFFFLLSVASFSIRVCTVIVVRCLFFLFISSCIFVCFQQQLPIFMRCFVSLPETNLYCYRIIIHIFFRCSLQLTVG